MLVPSEFLHVPYITCHLILSHRAGALTVSDSIGRFLGVNKGSPLQRKLSKMAILLFALAVVAAIVCMAGTFLTL